MKKIMMVVLSLVIGSAAYAAGMFDGMTKEQLDNYEILVVDKAAGKVVGRMSRSEYKVVKIEDNSDATIPVISFAVKTKVATATESKNNNSVILHGGVGKKGLSNKYNDGVYEVAEKDEAVFGATYCRNGDKLGLCGTAVTNKTFLLGVKLDF